MTTNAAGFYSPADVVGLLRVSPTTLWRMVRRKEFPAPVRISEQRVGYERSAVNQWMATRRPAGDGNGGGSDVQTAA